MRIVRPSHLLHVNVICTLLRVRGSCTLARVLSSSDSDASSESPAERPSPRTFASATRERRDRCLASLERLSSATCARAIDGETVAKSARGDGRQMDGADDDGRELALRRARRGVADATREMEANTAAMSGARTEGAVTTRGAVHRVGEFIGFVFDTCSVACELHNSYTFRTA